MEEAIKSFEPNEVQRESTYSKTKSAFLKKSLLN